MMQAISRQSLADQIGKAAANAVGPKAKAAALASQAAMAQSAIPYLMRADALSADGGASPEAKVRFLVPEQHQAKALEEIAMRENAKKAETEMVSLFDKAKQENSLAPRVGRLWKDAPAISAMRSLAIPLISDAAGRVSETELHIFEGMMPKPLDNAGDVARKLENMQHWLAQKKAAPTAKAFGLDLDKYDSTSVAPSTVKDKQGNPVKAAWADWAAANPNHSAAANLTKKLGR